MRSADFKAMAKDALRGNWFIAIIAGILATILGASTLNTFVVSFDYQQSDTTVPEEGSEAISTAFDLMNNISDYDKAWLILSAVVLGLAFFMMIYLLIVYTVGSAVSVGYCQFNLDLVDSGSARVGTLFSRFAQMGDAIVVKLLTLVYVMLGLLLFIIPGVRMMFAYSMANFVLAENPEMRASQALRESKRIMKGHKWKLFCLNLSFLGPILLSILTLGIGFIWLIPYANATYAAFYREAKNDAGY